MLTLQTGTLQERVNILSLGAGITLTQNSDGLATIDVVGALTQAAADIRYGQLAASNTWTQTNVFSGNIPLRVVFTSSPTNGLQIAMGDSSVWGVFGTTQSGGYMIMAHNAYQNTWAVDSWTQSYAPIKSALFEVGPNGIALYSAVAGKAVGNKATFWGAAVFSVSEIGTLNVAGHLIIPPTKALYLDGGSDTYITEVGSNQIRLVAGGTVLIDATATNWAFGNQNVIVLATQKLFLDGGFDTYIYEVSANIMDFYAGAVRAFVITATDVNSMIDFKLVATKKLYLDSGGDTYLVESAANQVDLYTGGAVNWRATTTSFAISGRDLFVDSAKKIYLDGGSNTYIYEGSADAFYVVTGGTTSMYWTALAVAMPATNKFYFDGGGDTYIYESSANTIELFAGGSQSWITNTTLFAVGPTRDLVIGAAKKFYVDSGGDTYFYESSANVLDTVVGGALVLRQNSTQVAVGGAANLSVEATKRVYFDGGSDTYAYEATANRIDLVAGGVANFQMTSTSITTAGFILGASNKGIVMGSSFFGQQGSGYGEVGYNNSNGAGSTNYLVTDFASRIRFNSGGISFQTAPSGSAGGAITFTERALITASTFTTGLPLVVSNYISVGVASTNGYIYFGTDNAYFLQRDTASWGAGFLGTNGGLKATLSIDTAGQHRATGWYGSGDTVGLGAEMGVSGGSAYFLCYNRSSSAYGVVYVQGSEINLSYFGGPAYLDDNTNTKRRLAAIVISNAAPSGTAPTGTIWFQY